MHAVNRKGRRRDGIATDPPTTTNDVMTISKWKRPDNSSIEDLRDEIAQIRADLDDLLADRYSTMTIVADLAVDLHRLQEDR